MPAPHRLFTHGDVEFHEHEALSLRKAMVVECFPTVGLVSTIAGAYLTRELGLRRAGSVSAPWFPPVAVVADGRPLAPVRIYQGPNACGIDGDCKSLVVVISEMPIPDEGAYALAEALLEWVVARGGRELVSLEGLPVRGIPAHQTQEGVVQVAFEQELPPVQGLATSPRTQEALGRLGIPPLEAGIVSGVSGVIMARAEERDFDALCLLAHAYINFPDARAAASLVRTMDALLKGMVVDIKPLLEHAAELEEHIKRGVEQLVSVTAPGQRKPSEPSPAMYR